MRKMNLFIILLLTTVTYSQWTYNTITSDFDGTFKKAFTKTVNDGYLFMEEPEQNENDSIKSPFIGLKGTYFCDDKTIIDFVLKTSTESKKYEIYATKSRDSKSYFFDFIWDAEFLKYFKSANKVSIRVRQSYCEDDFYEFNFNGSTNAYNFITN